MAMEIGLNKEAFTPDSEETDAGEHIYFKQTLQRLLSVKHGGMVRQSYLLHDLGWGSGGPNLTAWMDPGA